MNYNPFSLEGKTIFVTGASSGIGESIAIEISKMGSRVIINGRDTKRLNQTFIQLMGDNNKQIVADLSKIDDIDLLASSLPQLDGLIFCAGMVKTVPVKNILDTAIEEVFQTNLFSTIQLIRRLLKAKKINKGASIVLISSISTSNAKAGNALYSATKGALNSFGKVLALELANQKIKVNIIQPGFIKSRILDDGIITEDQIEENIKRYPLGAGKPTDIAYACIYLLSDAADWITGSILTIDGGITLKS
jgi:NAD(P)-dependent dehydrogenase (short-subunit alcohol dehydrogenase family)